MWSTGSEIRWNKSEKATRRREMVWDDWKRDDTQEQVSKSWTSEREFGGSGCRRRLPLARCLPFHRMRPSFCTPLPGFRCFLHRLHHFPVFVLFVCRVFVSFFHFFFQFSFINFLFSPFLFSSFWFCNNNGFLFIKVKYKLNKNERIEHVSISIMEHPENKFYQGVRRPPPPDS